MRQFLKYFFAKVLFIISPIRVTGHSAILMFVLLVLILPFTASANISKYIDFKEFKLLEDCGTITDIDGNVYETVMIAGTCWIKSNLKVKHYRNGDPIPEVKDRDEWAALKTGAWCYYDNDPANEEKYGLLYNFYAVEDPRGLGPEGWEVPSTCEVHNLIVFLDHKEAGDKVRSPEDWPYNPNINPNNESGLTLLPSGARTGYEPDFGTKNWAGKWWTRTIGNFWWIRIYQMIL